MTLSILKPFKTKSFRVAVQITSRCLPGLSTKVEVQTLRYHREFPKQTKELQEILGREVTSTKRIPYQLQETLARQQDQPKHKPSTPKIYSLVLNQDFLLITREPFYLVQEHIMTQINGINVHITSNSSIFRHMHSITYMEIQKARQQFTKDLNLTPWTTLNSLGKMV